MSNCCFFIQRFFISEHIIGGSLDDNIWTLLVYLYLCHLLEFNSHLTGDPQSTEFANDNSPS